MALLFLLGPAVALAIGVSIYRHTGKKEIFRFDVVQFLYAFVLVPLMYVCLKYFIFYDLKNELEINLSVEQMFFIDTVFSVIFLYASAIMVIHTLTKSFALKISQDPLHDLFAHSEYFHLWFSHIIIYNITLLIFVFLSVLNLFVPLEVPENKIALHLTLFIGVVSGLLAFKSIRYYNPPQKDKFMRLMKIEFGLAYLLHQLIFIFSRPAFSIRYLMFWFCFLSFATVVLIFLFFDGGSRARKWLRK